VQYNESIYFDKALYKQDILGSIAFARANAKSGIISQDEFSKIESGPPRRREGMGGRHLRDRPGRGRGHPHRQRATAGRIIGKDVAGKLHTGRSRNELVATGMRMWLRDELRKLEGYMVSFLRVMSQRAEQEIDYVMPGYTLQRAQPIRWSH
jgi:argininosuccinate lyase